MGIHFSASVSSASSPAPSFELAARPSLRGRCARIVLACLGAGLLLAPLFVSSAFAQEDVVLTAKDNTLLDEIQERSVRFFVEHSDPVTGLTRDRAPKNGHPGTSPASIASTGFALSAWCVADARGWLPTGEALTRVRQTLRFVADHVQHEQGWFYHFVDMKTGRRSWQSEASTIDTALFLQGAVQAREYLHDPEVSELVNRIYGRVDWRWAMNGGKTLSHGWRPEGGFIRWRWDSYSELMGMYLLGIGAPTRALPADSWNAWRRPKAQYAGRTFIQGGPLFTHQYAQAWFDFRGQRDAYADYWQNSVDATLAQRAWFGSLKNRFPLLSEDLWGLTASDSARGYKAWGTPGHLNERTDGTLVPCAPGGSLPFAPRECLTALERMRQVGGADVWGRYGFADAFNPHTGWSASDVIGIDVGITLVMAENLRTGLIWDSFMRAPEVQRGMALAGFKEIENHPRTLAKRRAITPALAANE
jgi:hypothetical protein